MRIAHHTVLFRVMARGGCWEWFSEIGDVES